MYLSVNMEMDNAATIDTDQVPYPSCAYISKVKIIINEVSIFHLFVRCYMYMYIHTCTSIGKPTKHFIDGTAVFCATSMWTTNEPLDGIYYCIAALT